MTSRPVPQELVIRNDDNFRLLITVGTKDALEWITSQCPTFGAFGEYPLGENSYFLIPDKTYTVKEVEDYLNSYNLVAPESDKGHLMNLDQQAFERVRMAILLDKDFDPHGQDVTLDAKSYPETACIEIIAAFGRGFAVALGRELLRMAERLPTEDAKREGSN